MGYIACRSSFSKCFTGLFRRWGAFGRLISHVLASPEQGTPAQLGGERLERMTVDHYGYEKLPSAKLDIAGQGKGLEQENTVGDMISSRGASESRLVAALTSLFQLDWSLLRCKSYLKTSISLVISKSYVNREGDFQSWSQQFQWLSILAHCTIQGSEE